jgi:predicted SAM-dependent methyltransferase
VKLNLGCGQVKKKGYLNVDINRKSAADIVSSVVKMPFFDDCSVEEILCNHLLEHLSIAESEEALQEWFRILKHGGKIIIESPDLQALCKEFLNADKVNRWYSYKGTWHPLIKHFYGNQRTPGQFHKSGYTQERIKDLLTMTGFRQITFLEQTEYKYSPCFRVKAHKV